MAGQRPEAWRATGAAYAVAVAVFAGHLLYGANSTALSLMFAAIWFAILAALVIRREARAAIQATRLVPLAVPFGAVLALAALSLTPLAIGGAHPVWQWAPGAMPVGSIDPYATRLEMLKLLALAAAFLVGCVLGADDERFRGAMRAILTVGIVYGAWAFVDHATSPGLLFGAPRNSDPTRLAASFGSSNTAATLFGFLTLLNIVDLVRVYDKRRPSGRFHVGHLQRLAPHLVRPLIACAVSASCLVLTFSRGGLAATAVVAVALVGFLMLGRARRGAGGAAMSAILITSTCLLLAFLAINADMLQQRVLAAREDGVLRGQIFAAHWAAFQVAPLGGYGLGTFVHINTMIMSQANLAALDLLGATHNVYIQWLEEAGAPAALAMFATVGVIGVALIRGAMRRIGMRSWILAILAGLALFLLHGASDYALQTPSMALFLSLTLGLGCGASGRSQSA